jgi:hypothetical protein
MARYDIKQSKPDRFDLYEDGSLLCSFTRSTFRESLEHIGRGNNWIGSILRIFLKKFPPFHPVRSRNSLQRAVEVYGESGFVDYLRGMGLRVVRPLGISDRMIIDFLEPKGYVISGLLGDVYYESSINENRGSEGKVPSNV